MPKVCSRRAIRDDNPVVFFEDKMMYQFKGPVPTEEYTIPLGVADVKRVGSDITLVATSSMVQVALVAAEILLDNAALAPKSSILRTTAPLDKQTIDRSAKKTSRAIVIDEGYERYGVTGGDRLGDCRWRVLLSRCAGQTHGRHGRAGAVLAGA